MIPSIRKNIAFNYGGQLYSTLIGILVLPLFLKYVGAEAYGLIGFYTLVTAWMNLLDMGMTPTLGREVARFKEHPSQHWRLISVVNTLESLFLVFATVLGASLIFMRGWISRDWLNVETLPMETVSTSVGIIAITVATRWVSSINRSGINAYEAQVWVNITDVVVNTLRFPGSLILVIWSGGNILAFFYFQLVVVVIEVFVIRLKFRTLMPKGIVGAKRFSTKELKRVAPFALGIGYTGAIWVFLTQLDKLILSRVLSLSDYGYFTLVATIASGVTMLAGPVSKAVLPRMTALLARGEKDQMIAIYRRSTRLVISFVAPITMLVALMPGEVVYTWTGDREAAHWAKQVLPLFVLGSGLLVVVAFQYYLQYAFGVLKYHVAYNTVSVLVNIPLIIYVALNYGALGVAWVWFGFRTFSFLFWVPFIHYKFLPGVHKNWLLKDVVFPLIPIITIIFLGSAFFNRFEHLARLEQAAILVGISLSATLVTIVVVFGRLTRSESGAH